jgi:hypothetical protein
VVGRSLLVGRTWLLRVGEMRAVEVVGGCTIGLASRVRLLVYLTASWSC